jgi:hypothetical protein
VETCGDIGCLECRDILEAIRDLKNYESFDAVIHAAKLVVAVENNPTRLGMPYLNKMLALDNLRKAICGLNGIVEDNQKG